MNNDDICRQMYKTRMQEKLRDEMNERFKRNKVYPFSENKIRKIQVVDRKVKITEKI